MKDVEIKFEREGLEGIVPVGTYLADAARRLGVRFPEPCVSGSGEHFCAVTITHGGELLSPPTSIETAYFEAHGSHKGQRLADQAKIERPGEISVMTTEKKTEKKDESEVDDKNEQYRKEFSEMPLEKKIASLVHLEAIALGETFSFILNSPYMIIDKAMDVMAEFGFKKEEAARRAGRPEEHAAGSGDEKQKAECRSKKSTKAAESEK